jgi:peptidoglycan/LPS O-acetylase OafA/YrhL
VDLFFVLSGFVMWLTYGDKFQKEGLSAAPQFLWRRIARIYPLHFLIIVATMAYASTLAFAGKPNDLQYPFEELPLHFLLVQNWWLTDFLTWNDPSWSISAELAAYILLPLAAVTLFRKDWSPLACTIGAIVLALALHIWFLAHGEHTIGKHIVWNGLPRCFAGFFAGVLVAMLWRAKLGPQVTLFAFVIALSSFAMFVVGIAPETFAMPLAFTALVYWLAMTSSAPRNPLCGRLVLHLGDVSYSTYLGHFLLWIVFKHVFVDDPKSVPLSLIGLYLLSVYLSSIILYRLVEAPGRTLLQSVGKRGASTAAA